MNRGVLFFVTFFLFTVSFASTFYTEDKRHIMVSKKEPQFVIVLQSNPTTGYAWFLRNMDGALIQPVKHEYKKPQKGMMGAPSEEVWIFNVQSNGFIVPRQTELHFVYARPWSNEANAKELLFQVSTSDQ